MANGTVLVTGGAGFIGSNLVRALVGRGERVVALDNEFLGTMRNLDGVECTRIKADVLDRELLARTVEKHGVDRVAHLAGYTSAPMYAEDPRGRILGNYEQWINVLDLARQKRLKLVYASTSSFYARCPKPFREDMPITPATPYELSKFTMEQAAHTYAREFGVTANGLRFFSVYGPHEKHKTRYANNISQFYWSMKAGVRPVVFGDGNQTRDFTFVGDLVDAILRILDRGQGSEVYNIGTGQEHSFNEMIQLLNDALGTRLEPRYVQNPLKNYVFETLADTSKIEKDMGWKARTSLQQGIQRLVEADEPVTREEAEALYAWLRERPVAATVTPSGRAGA